MARKPGEIYNQILEVAQEPLKSKLTNNAPLWAPEIFWEQLTEYVNRYQVPSSQDPVSVKVYATLCGCTESEMKERFVANGR